MKAFKNKKQKMLRPLKTKWNMHTTGLLAVDKNEASFPNAEF